MQNESKHIGTKRVIFKNDHSHIISSRLKKFENQNTSPGLSIKFASAEGESYKINKNRYFLKPDEVFIVNEGNEIHSEVNSQELVNGTCIYFKSELLNEAFHRALAELNYMIPQPGEGKSFEFYEGNFKLKQLGLMRPNNSRLNHSEDANTEEYLYFLAYHLAQAQLKLDSLNKTTRIKTKSTSSEIVRRLLVAKDYLESNLKSNIALDELSQQACLSKFYLLRHFTRAFGMTPHKFHISLRLEKTKECILKKENSISAISEEYGFNDPAVYSKAFKRKYGLSPSELVKSNF